jgi:hypothetical protein
MPEKIRTGRGAALLSAGYAVAGYLLAFEERDLIAGLGDTYRAYRAEVPAVIPALRSRKAEGARTEVQAAGQGHCARKEEQAA